MKTRKVILLGKMQKNLEKGLAVIDAKGIEFMICTSLQDLAEAPEVDGVDAVVAGAGLGLAVRLEAIKMIFETSDSICVHMKDFASGPEGFGPFANRVLASSQET